MSLQLLCRRRRGRSARRNTKGAWRTVQPSLHLLAVPKLTVWGHTRLDKELRQLCRLAAAGLTHQNEHLVGPHFRKQAVSTRPDWQLLSLNRQRQLSSLLRTGLKGGQGRRAPSTRRHTGAPCVLRGRPRSRRSHASAAVGRRQTCFYATGSAPYPAVLASKDIGPTEERSVAARHGSLNYHSCAPFHGAPEDQRASDSGVPLP